ncbi:RNA-binding S4 domain-containing protein [Candidatus Woesearchaeota archaeon]|nr:RNA-binding S4 domain-containing protein [Candidatus Woesearchaeota archaeon]
MTQDILTKWIELNNFLKVLGIANTGGLAKRIIRSGEIKVNGEAETRNKRKLRAGDTVEYLGKTHVVKEELLR